MDNYFQIATDLPLFSIITLIVVSLMDAGFTYFIFTRYERSLSIVFFGLFALIVSSWVFANGFGVLFQPGAGFSDFMGRSTFVFAAFMVAFLYLFVLMFPFPIIKIERRFIGWVLILPTLLSLHTYFSNNLIEGFTLDKNQFPIYGKDFWLYATYILGIFVLIITELFLKFRRTDGVHRWQTKYFLISILLSGTIAISTNLILPYIFKTTATDWIGPSSTIIWLSICIYIINKKG